MGRKFLLMLGLLLALPASAQLYKWTDEHGKVHFTDQPPAEVKSEEVTVKPPPRIGQGDGVRDIQERLDRLRQAEKEQAAEEAAVARETEARESEIRRQCGLARRELQKYEHRVFNRNPDGSRSYLTDEEYAANKSKISAWIEKNCKGY